MLSKFPRQNSLKEEWAQRFWKSILNVAVKSVKKQHGDRGLPVLRKYSIGDKLYEEK